MKILCCFWVILALFQGSFASSKEALKNHGSSLISQEKKDQEVPYNSQKSKMKGSFDLKADEMMMFQKGHKASAKGNVVITYRHKSSLSQKDELITLRCHEVEGFLKDNEKQFGQFKKIIAKSHVHIVRSIAHTIIEELECAECSFDIDSGDIFCKGPVVLKKDNQVLRGMSASGNVKSGDYRVQKGFVDVQISS